MRNAWMTIVIGGLMLGSATSVMARDKSAAARLEDRVEQRFHRDKSLDQLHVDVENGVTVLRGKVATQAERDRAEQAARRAGARRIDNRIELDVGEAKDRIEDAAKEKKEQIEDRADREKKAVDEQAKESKERIERDRR